MSAKDEVLSKAQEMFLSIGFKSVTMDDIASELGISKKTLYGYFSNKNELVRDAAMGICCQICDGVEDLTCEHLNPIEELYEIKKYVITHLKGDKSSSIYQLQKYYPKVHRDVSGTQYDFIRKCLAENIQRGLAMELYRANVDPDFIARIYFVCMQGIKDISLFPPDQFPPQELHEKFLEYHLRGIVTPKGRKILNKIINTDFD